MRLHKVKLALITVLCLLNCTAVLFRLVVNMPVRLIEELRFFFSAHIRHHLCLSHRPPPLLRSQTSSPCSRRPPDQ